VCNIEVNMTSSVQLDTSFGKIVLELYGDIAPRTCYSFEALAEAGYYDDTIFHRLIADFMIQGGDPTGTGKGGECAYGGMMEDEINPALRHTGAGILSMANSGPGTNGSQFFITLAPAPWLDGKHTIFGRVRSGMMILQKMNKARTANEKPIQDIKILSARKI